MPCSLYINIALHQQPSFSKIEPSSTTFDVAAEKPICHLYYTIYNTIHTPNFIFFPFYLNIYIYIYIFNYFSVSLFLLLSFSLFLKATNSHNYTTTTINHPSPPLGAEPVPTTRGRARTFCLGGPICVANLLVYKNFYIHTQTHVSIHTHTKNEYLS